MQESLPGLIGRFLPLKQNGSGYISRCPFHDDEGESFRVGEKAWHCLACGQQDDGDDSIGFLMSWCGCSREEAISQLGNGDLPAPMPVLIPPLKRPSFWGIKALATQPQARVWIHWTAAGVNFGREHLPDRAHLGLCSGRSLDDASISLLNGRSCFLLPDNREHSLERMDILASKLYASGHGKVRYIEVSKQPTGWSWPNDLTPEQALAFALAHAKPYPKHSNAAPDPATASPSSSQGLDRGAASDAPGRAQSVSAHSAHHPSETPQIAQPAPKRGNGAAGSASGPITPPERAAAYLAQARAEMLSGLVYTCIADVQPEAVKWLWPGRIPLGELTMVVGDPGLGKSQICASLASVVTNGGQWPVDRTRAEQGSVLILSAEDNIKHTIRPRLDAAQADVSRCHSLQAVKRIAENGTSIEGGFNLAEDLAKLSVLMHELRDVKLVIIDPVSAYLGETDSHKNAEVRGMLAPLTTLAGNHNAAIILVSHLTKSQSANALMRVQGSIAFSALCRAVWGVTADKEDHSRRLFMPLKNNLGQDKTGLAYAIESYQLEGKAEDGEPIPTSRVMWESELVQTSVDEAFGASLSHDERTEMDEAKEFLREALSDGRVKAQDVQRMAKAAGHSLTTLGRAKRVMHIESKRDGFGAGSAVYWQLKAASQEAQAPRCDDPR